MDRTGRRRHVLHVAGAGAGWGLAVLLSNPLHIPVGLVAFYIHEIHRNCPPRGGLSGPEVRRRTSSASGCIGGLQAQARVPAPPDALPIATMARDCPMRPPPPPSTSPSGREARVADRARAPRARYAQRFSVRSTDFHPTASPGPYKSRVTNYSRRRHDLHGTYYANTQAHCTYRACPNHPLTT